MSGFGIKVPGGGAPALMRAAEAMLRTLGGAAITLLFPVSAASASAGSELGLAIPGVEEADLSPAVVLSLSPDPAGAELRLEVLLPASAVSALVEARQTISAQNLFDSALGLLHEGKLMRIASVAGEFFAGTAYLYRVIVVE